MAVDRLALTSSEADEELLNARLEKAETYEERAEIRALLRSLKKEKTSLTAAPSQSTATTAKSKTSQVNRPISAAPNTSKVLSAEKPAEKTESLVLKPVRVETPKNSCTTPVFNAPPPFGKHLLKHTERPLNTEAKQQPIAEIRKPGLRHPVAPDAAKIIEAPRLSADETSKPLKPAVSVSTGSDDALFLAWLSQALPETPAHKSMGKLADAGKDGILWCKLCNSVAPGTVDVRALNTNVGTAIKARENMALFYNSAKSLGAHLPSNTEEKLLIGDQSAAKAAISQLMKVAFARNLTFLYMAEKPTRKMCDKCTDSPDPKYIEVGTKVICESCAMKPQCMAELLAVNKVSASKINSASALNVKPAVSPNTQRSFTTNNATDALLRWCQMKTFGYEGVSVHDFSESWSDGLAFCALMCTLSGFANINYDHMRKATRVTRFETAFKLAEKHGVPLMLDANDMSKMSQPDKFSVTLYISEIYKAFK